MAASAPRNPWWPRLWAWLGGSWAFTSQLGTARLLHRFACTEAQSQLELREAAAACSDDRRRALYLRHALDEARHARAFAELAADLARAAGRVGFGHPAAGSEGLYERFGEARFLAFVHHGERNGRAEFEVYAELLRKRGAEAQARLFDTLVQDERQHEAYTLRLLDELAGNAEARRALRWAARWIVWRAFRRQGRRLAGFVYAASMLVIYVALTPYALAYRWLSRPRPGFSSEP